MLLKLENCAYSYKNQLAFQDISFSIERNEILCICGRNGSGKSTLLQLMAGILEQEKGKIYLEEKEIDNTSILQENSALLFQEPDLQLLGQDVLEEILLIFPNPNEEEKQRAKELLTRFNLWEKRKNSIHALSFGEKRKLALASALMEKPKLLLLDEPSAGLDYPAELELVKIVEENKKQGLSQCIATHDLGFCASLVDKILLLDKGRQVYFGDLSKGLKYIEEHPEIGIKLPR